MKQKEKLATAATASCAAACFACPLVLDLALGLEHPAWGAAKLALIFLLFLAGFIARGADREASTGWFKKHRVIQGTVVCLSCMAFGAILSTTMIS